jgi:hypothetical protein
MAQTKRKRRNKHRGNAVGVVEARGRTSKPREGQPRKGGSAAARGGARPMKQPSLQNSALKALFGAAILFILFTVTNKDQSVGGTLLVCVVAMVIYTPIMYATDKWVYQRRLRQQQGGGGGAPRGRR